MIENMLDEFGIMVEIQTKSLVSEDSYEGQKYEWVKKADIKAVFNTATYISRMSQRIVSNKLSDEVSHLLYILPTDVRPTTDRIYKDGKLYVILLVDNHLQADRFYTVFLKESGNNEDYI